MKIKWLIYCMAIIILAVSCKSKKNISQKATISKTPIEKVIERVKQQEPKFKSANVSKMSLSLDLNGRSIKVAASCKMISDSAIHISIMPALGIEMFKVEISKDSIYVFDKLNKKYYATNYQYIERKFGVSLDYNSIESLISNRFFIVGQKDIPFSKLSLDISTDKQAINYNGGNMTESVSLNNLYGIESVNIYSVNSKYNLTASYSAFALFNDINFPQKIMINATNNKNKMLCDFNISRVTFNTSVSLEPIDKYRFQKSDIEQLIKK